MTTASNLISIDPVTEIHEILLKGGNGGATTLSEVDTCMAKIFDLARKYFGISQENYLPWNSAYLEPRGYIAICPGTLKNKKLVWGYDPLGRPFIAFRYLFECLGWKASRDTTIFQRLGGYGKGEIVVQWRNKTIGVQKVKREQLKELEILFKEYHLSKKFEYIDAQGEVVESEERTSLITDVE